MSERPPLPTFELVLSIGACDWTDLVHRLREEAEHIAKHGPACRAVWGGAGTHGHVEITHRPEVTRESYEKELHEWWVKSRADGAKPFPNRSSAPETKTAPVEAGAVNHQETNDL